MLYGAKQISSCIVRPIHFTGQILNAVHFLTQGQVVVINTKISVFINAILLDHGIEHLFATIALQCVIPI